MARPKSASHDLKRDAILDLAAHCFAQRSYHAASMNSKLDQDCQAQSLVQS